MTETITYGTYLHSSLFQRVVRISKNFWFRGVHHVSRHHAPNCFMCFTFILPLPCMHRVVRFQISHYRHPSCYCDCLSWLRDKRPNTLFAKQCCPTDYTKLLIHCRTRSRYFYASCWAYKPSQLSHGWSWWVGKFPKKKQKRNKVNCRHDAFVRIMVSLPPLFNWFFVWAAKYWLVTWWAKWEDELRFSWQLLLNMIIWVVK